MSGTAHFSANENIRGPGNRRPGDLPPQLRDAFAARQTFLMMWSISLDLLSPTEQEATIEETAKLMRALVAIMDPEQAR